LILMSSSPEAAPSTTPYLVVVSDEDPVATRVAQRWGTPPATGDHVDGAAIRTLSPNALLLRRTGLHIHDEHLDTRLPTALREPGVTLVFPSIHASESQVPCLTVHPLGNPGDTSEVGGRPRVLVPTDPRLMVATLRALSERSGEAGLKATYEATHHGPELAQPAMFVEIGYGPAPAPSEAAVGILADLLPHLVPAEGDRAALAVGGGHYAPHFTDLALKRRWAFGHILSRHALLTLDGPTARTAFAMSPGADGWLPARAEDAGHRALVGVGSRLRDSGAEARPRPSPRTTDASGT
jgi:D-tyrosyl-tRNA(Tyr) deacylase